MKVRIQGDIDDYHPSDTTFSTQCVGWERAVKEFGIPEELSKTERSRYETQGDYYREHIPQLQPEHARLLNPAQFGKILEIYASHLFLLAALKAENSMNTDRMERELDTIKRIVRNPLPDFGLFLTEEWEVVGIKPPL